MPTRIHALLMLSALMTVTGFVMAGCGVYALNRAAVTQASCSEMIQACSEGLACMKRETP